MKFSPSYPPPNYMNSNILYSIVVQNKIAMKDFSSFCKIFHWLKIKNLIIVDLHKYIICWVVFYD